MSKQSIAQTLPIMKHSATRTLSRSLAVFSLVVILFIALRFWKITTFSLWGGEAFSMNGVKQSWMDMFSYAIADIVHPPLFYILLKLWIGLGGESLLWLKLLPVVSAIALVLPFYFLCRELNFQLPEMSLALFLAAVNGYLIHYAQELRMYSLFTFLSMCSFWLFIKYFKLEKKALGELIVLTIVNLLAIYTHYYGWLVVGMEFLFLLIWNRKKLIAFCMSILFLMVCFAPWAYAVFQEARSIGGLDRNLDWIPRPHLADILRLYKTFNGPTSYRNANLVGLLLFGLPLLLWGWRSAHTGFSKQNDDLMRFSWLALLAFLPVMAIFLVSQWTRQALWTDRYFIFIAVPYMMLVAAAIYQIRPYWLRNGWAVAVVLWSLLAGLNDLRTNQIAWEGVQMGSRADWDGLVRQLVAANPVKSSQPIPVYTLTITSRGLRTGDWALSMSIDYFLDQQGESGFETVYARDVYGLMKKADEDFFWVTFIETAESARPLPTRVLLDNGFRLGPEIVYRYQNNRVVFVPVWRQ